jgi:hypothetical protein
MEFLRDPLWQFIGAVIGGIGLVVAIVSFLQRKRKRLSYEIVSSSSLLSLDRQIKGKVKILYDGIEVEKVHLIVIRVYNSGNTPIKSGDYERPIKFSFGPSARILSFEVTETEPDNLDVGVTPDENSVSVDPLLLNSKDSILLTALVSEFDGLVNSDARIVGIKSIQEVDSKYTNLLQAFARAFASSLIGDSLADIILPKPKLRRK